MWSSRELLIQFTTRNVELRHKGSYLGLVWSILNPLLTLVLYVFVFGYVLGGSFRAGHHETRMDYALGVFLGLAIYHFFSEVLTTSPSAILNSPNMVKKVVFPLHVLPAANVGSALIHMLITMALVLLGIAVAGPGLGTHAFWAPAILLPLVPLALGVAWLFAALGVFFRDISQIVGLLSMALLFSSAIFYPANSLPPNAWAILRFNPLLLTVELARAAMLWDRPINLAHLAYVFGFSAIVFVFGFWVFRRTSPAFADVL